MSEDQLEIRYIPLDQAVLWDRNPKRHSIGDLDASFDRYGFKMPPRYEPHINGQGRGGIGAGNGRIKTLMMRRDQNRPPPRGILVRDDQWLVPILFGVDADSQAAAEAFGIDDNNLTLAGGDFTAYDMAKLWGEGYTDVLASLATSDALPITVDGDALDSLLVGLVPSVEPGNGGDDFDTTPADGPTRCKAGDLWIIKGNGIEHRLLVGDCTDPANVARLMGGERAALCFTDPPYLDEYVPVYGKMAATLPAVLEPGGSLLAIVPHFALPQIMADVGAHLRYRWIMSMSQTEGQHPRMAMGIEVLWKPIGWWVNGTWPQGRGFVRDGFENEPVVKDDHEWQQSLSWADYGLKFIFSNGPVYDPFLGSGTTLIAMHRHGHRCYGMEIAPKYADVILRRAEAEGLECRPLTE